MKESMRRMLAVLLLLAALLMQSGIGAAEIQPEEEELDGDLKVGNTTPLRGCFFTSLWGGTTSDLDVQDLLHSYSPVKWDLELVRFRYDHSVVQNAFALEDGAGNRTYVLVFYEDLCFSDGTPITAYDYAFSMLLQMDPAVKETGGRPRDFSWLLGSEEYINGERTAVAGIRIVTDYMLQITAKADAFPYFNELSRLMVYPYPIAEIAPGVHVMDDGEGAYLSEALTADLLKQTVLDSETGYLSHPKVVSGPYTLESFDGTMAKFQVNPFYKGNEEGMKPMIARLHYTLVENSNMIEQLGLDNFGLLNKVTMTNAIRGGIELHSSREDYALTNYMRTGLTLVRFMENSVKAQDPAVRKAVALCFDRDSFIRDYTGPFGIRMDAFCGIGQWMYRLATGQMTVEEDLEAAKVSLEGITVYPFDPEEAKKLLDQAGWTLNENGGAYQGGIRYKRIDGELVPLKLTMGFPDSEEERALLKTHLAPYLEQAGIQLSLRAVDMEILQTAYEKENMFDMLYVGEDFSIYFDPVLLEPEKPLDGSSGNLTSSKAELYAMALEMDRTDPYDVAGYMQKWVKLQKKITETLPVLPVYSNVYFDFYTRELHNYRITEAVTWGEAIVESFMSDIELLDEETQQTVQEQLAELENQYAEPVETEAPTAAP